MSEQAEHDAATEFELPPGYFDAMAGELGWDLPADGAPTVLGHTVEAKVSRVSQVPAGPLRETAARALDDGLHVWLVRHDGRLGVLVTNPGAPVAAWSS